MTMLQSALRWLHTFIEPVLFLALGLYFFPLEIMGLDLSKTPGEFGDARFNTYVLEHGYQYLKGTLSNYYDAPFMFPYPNVIALSDNHFGTLPFYATFRALGFARDTAFQLWILTLFALNYISTFFCLKTWFKSSRIAILGAYIFAFSIFILGNIYNVQTLPRFIVPWAVFFAWKWLQNFQIKHLCYTMLAVVYQFYCGIYLGLFLSLILSIFMLLVILPKRKMLWQNVKQTPTKTIWINLGFLLACCVPLVVLMIPYIKVSGSNGYPSYHEVLDTVPFIRSYFFTSEAPILWSWLSEHGKETLPSWWCHHVFSGITPIALLTGAITYLFITRKKNASNKQLLRISTITLLITIACTIRIENYSLYYFIHALPGFKVMRSINRMINVEIFLFILVGCAFLSQLKIKGKNLLLLALICFVVAENTLDGEKVIRFEKQEDRNRIATTKALITQNPNYKNKPVALVDKYPGDFIAKHLDVMLACQDLKIPSINGYTGSYPNDFKQFYLTLHEANLENWIHANSIKKENIHIIREQKTFKKVHIKSVANGKLLCADYNENDFVLANRTQPGEWETFFIEEYKEYSNLSSYTYRYFTPNNLGYIQANKNNSSYQERFILEKIDSNLYAIRTKNYQYWSLDPNNTKIKLVAGNTSSKNQWFEIINAE